MHVDICTLQIDDVTALQIDDVTALQIDDVTALQIDDVTALYLAVLRANSEMTSPKPSAESRNYQAMYDYALQGPKEMQLTKNDIVTVLDKSHKDWWKVQRGAEKGMVPANYLKPI